VNQSQPHISIRGITIFIKLLIYSSSLRYPMFRKTIFTGQYLDQSILDPGVDGVKRLRLMPKLFAFFSTAAARHFFDGDYDATYLKNFPGGAYLRPHPHDLRPCTLIGKGRKEPRPGSLYSGTERKRYSAHCVFIQYAVINHNQHKIPTL